MKKSPALRKSVFVLVALIALLGVPAASRAALVAAWGYNGQGQTQLPVGVNSIKAVAGGGYHGLALRSDGSVFAWGLNYQGQANVPAGLANVKAIAAGSDSSLALKVNGSVVAWGNNDSGQTNVPGNLSRVVAIASGGRHNLALKVDGTVIAWGDNYAGQTNVPIGLSDAIAIAAGVGHSLALKADGSVVAWGNNSSGQASVPPGLSNVVAIATRGYFNLALKSDGTVVAWGENFYGQTNVPVGLSNVTAIAAGFYHAMALTPDGTIVAWGDNTYGQTTVPPGLPSVTAIAAGGNHSLALVPEGPVQILQNPQSQGVPITSNVTFSVVATGFGPFSYQWWFNGSPIGSGNSRASGTTNATLTITNLQISDIGTYVVVVSNAFGSVLSSGASLVVISPPFITQQPTNRTARAGTDVSLPAAASGTPPLSYQWNFDGTNIPGAIGPTLFLPNAQPTASGTYYLTVSNAYGFAQTLTASLTVTDSPPYILRQSTNQTALIHGSVTFTVDARGSSPLSYRWRFNGMDIPNATDATLVLSNLRYDQIGYYDVEISNAFGTTNSAKVLLNVSQVGLWGYYRFVGDATMPVGLSNVIALAAGSSHLAALKADGTVKAWLPGGGNNPAITNVPTSATNVIAIAAYGGNDLALRSNGTVVAWGNNTYGQANVPAGLSNVVAIGAGLNRSFAVRSDGTVVGWGAAAIVPPGLSNVVAIAAGDYHNLALKQDGTVVAWGSSIYVPATYVPAGLSNVIAIAAGYSLSFALRQDGTVVAWWGSGDLQTTGLSNAIAMVSGGGYSWFNLALKLDGTVAGIGYVSQSPMLSSLSNVVAIAAFGFEQSSFVAGVIGDGSPAFTVQPFSQTVAKGAMVQLHARAAGVQPMSYQWQLENQNLPGATNADLIITNAQGKDAGGYRMIVSNALGTAMSRVATLTIPYNTNLAAALNTNNWQWFSEDPTSWFAQNRETHDGDVAAQSGAISNSQQSVLQTAITGPGTLTFWWKVSSEEGFDFLRFYLDPSATPLAGISGESGWEQRTIHLDAGTHSLRWIYSKDASVSAGRDAGWLDDVYFTPDPPAITVQPAPSNLVLPAGTSTAFWLAVRGIGPFSFQWFKDTVSIAGATNTSFFLPQLTRRDSATYYAQVSNAGGSVISSNVTLKVIVPQRLGALRFTADGNSELLARDADGGALLPQDLPAFEAQASTNLVIWEPLPNALSLTNGSLVLRDPGGTNFRARFYRMVEH